MISERRGLPVTQIVSKGFKDQTELKRIRIPPSVKQIEEAFDGCTALERVIFAQSDGRYRAPEGGGSGTAVDATDHSANAADLRTGGYRYFRQG